MRYAHTNIVAENWEKLAEFYQRVFACVPVPPVRDLSGEWLDRASGVRGAHLRGMHLRLPGHGNNGPTLEIFSYSEMEGKSAPAANRKGFGHIAFQVDDVSAARANVLANGGTDLGQPVEVEIPAVGRLTFLYMTDPEGNILEIQNWS